MTQLFLIKNNNSTTVISKGYKQVFLDSFEFYPQVLDAVAEGDLETVQMYADIYNALTSEDSVVIFNDAGQLSINDTVLTVDNKITKFISKLKDGGVTGESIDYIKPFIKNMMENPYIDAVEELYDYCKEQDFIITEDGCFLAYKNIRNDWTSIHDGKTLHHLGTIVEENYFDTDRTQTCSKGLHFCSKGYLKHFSVPNCRTIIVKVNPKDVVAIPVDYDNMKGRCRRYEVLQEINPQLLLRDYYGQPNSSN